MKNRNRLPLSQQFRYFELFTMSVQNVWTNSVATKFMSNVRRNLWLF